MTFRHQTTSGTNPDDRRRGVSTLTGYRYYAARLEAELAALAKRIWDIVPVDIEPSDFRELQEIVEKFLPGVPHPEGPVPHSDPLPQHPDHHDDSPVVAAAMFDGAFTW